MPGIWQLIQRLARQNSRIRVPQPASVGVNEAAVQLNPSLTWVQCCDSENIRMLRLLTQPPAQNGWQSLAVSKQNSACFYKSMPVADLDTSLHRTHQRQHIFLAGTLDECDMVGSTRKPMRCKVCAIVLKAIGITMSHCCESLELRIKCVWDCRNALGLHANP